MKEISKDNIRDAYIAYQRVCHLFWTDSSFDRGALSNYLHEYLEGTGLRFPGIALRYEGGKYNSDFQEWLTRLDVWFDTVAALYSVTLPKNKNEDGDGDEE